jgi:hypothetical protein
MNYKTSYALPRLVIEKSRTIPGRAVGFLLLGMSGKKIEIGNIDSREFRLMLCLFSPKNFLSAKYEPVLQTHERVFETIRTSADSLNPRLASRADADIEMAAIVEKSITSLRGGEVGRYFRFISDKGRVRMEIFPSPAAAC